MRLGPLEIGIIVAVVVLLFGAKRLPSLGKGMGEFLKNFKSSIKDVEKESDEVQQKLHT